MIFLSLGTHEQPFERAIDAVLAIAGGEEVVVQHGHTPARTDVAGCRWIEFTPYERVVELMGDADVIACHAGVGTIMTAMSLGRKPVVLPRLARHGEHVDDHQLQITRHFAEKGFVFAWTPEADLAELLEQSRGAVLERERGSGALRRAIVRAARGQQPAPSALPIPAGELAA